MNTKRAAKLGQQYMSKGQLISKGLFGFFNSPKKRTKKFCPSRLGQKSKFSSSFFGNFLSRLTDLQYILTEQSWRKAEVSTNKVDISTLGILLHIQLVVMSPSRGGLSHSSAWLMMFFTSAQNRKLSETSQNFNFQLKTYF